MNNNDLTSESVISLGKNIAIRFEHNFNGGSIILIDTINDEFWIGNSESEKLIKILAKNKELKICEVFAQILSEYEEVDYEIVLNSLNKIINILYEKNFISILN